MGSVKSIELPNTFDIYKNLDGKPVGSLKPISSINIFVGSNNSGKSRFMRLLSAQAEYQAVLGEIDLDQINLQIESILGQLKDALTRNGFREANGFSNQLIDGLLPLPRSLNLKTDSYNKLRDTFTKWSDFTDISSWSSLSGRGGSNIPDRNRTDLRDTIRAKSTEALHVLEKVPIHSDVTSPQRVYIPVLRGLRPIDTAHTDLYAERTKADYFSLEPTNTNPGVFTGLSLYQQLTDMLLGDNSERKIISDYQNFISKTLFENRPIALIPSPRTKAVVVKIGNEKEQPIFHLGDGIQSAIILSFLPYITKEPTFFFIEEPEMYLHPGLQRKVISFFASLNRHTFFLTTHSNHFLDLTIDIKNVSIFTFRKVSLRDDEGDEQTPNFTIEAVDSGNHSSLELLGVRNSSVFLVNATIWVEGITDRWYLRTMLNSYMDYLSQIGPLTLKIEEDVHYSFVEYGGANITHWSFLEYEEHPIEIDRLCAKALVVIDKDGATKLHRKEALSNILGDRLILLAGREVENLLPYNVIKEVVIEYEGTPDRDLPNIEYSSYQDKYLGDFIENEILDGDFVRKGGYKRESGTIKSKVDFCEKALPRIRYTDLPQTTREIIERVYEFIRAQNG
jgi:hypothetical protein